MLVFGHRNTHTLPVGHTLCMVSTQYGVIVVILYFVISVPNSWFEVNLMYHISARVIIVHQNLSLELQTTRHRLVTLS